MTEDQSTPVGAVGIIYPPPEIRAIVEKTAAFVARNGAQFEERIKENERHNNKFSFLNPNDPYRPFYDMKVKESREAGGGKKDEKDKAIGAAAQNSKTYEKAIPKEPPAFEFIAPMPNISAQDLDILKLTALFVARNGRQFLSALSQREQRNFQFEFIKQNHSLYPYFTSLVSQYSKVIIPAKAHLNKLQELMDNKYSLLAKIGERVEYEKYIADKKRQAEEEADQERIAYSLIDWHDFVVVETVEFVDADEVLQLPPPISIMDLEGMSLAQKKATSLLEPSEQINGADDDDDMPIDNDEPSSNNIPPGGEKGMVSQEKDTTRTGPPIKLPQIPGRPQTLPPAPLPSLPFRPPTLPPPRIPIAMPPASSSALLPPRPTTNTRPADEDEDTGHDSKRQKIAEEFEASLIPESTFMAANPGNIMLIVQVQGSSAVTVTDLPLTTTVLSLKERLTHMTNIQMNKQKLSLPNGFTLRNTCSLAYYNLRNAGTLILTIKKRGG